MKKRLIALLLTLVCVLGLFAAVPAYADEPETTAPVEETAAPADETAAPADETAAPADETAAPAEETAAPAEETAAPAEETAAPAEETAAPAEETAEPTATPEPTASPEPTATPAPTGPWYQPAMDYAKENGLLKGDDKGNMNPTKNATRAEIATILSRVFGVATGKDISHFTDMSSGAWYYSPMSIMADMGILKGDADYTMRPNAAINRQEAFALIARSFCVPEGDVSSLKDFTDASQITDWAKKTLAGMVEAGLVRGDKNMLNPKGNITRAEFAQVLYNLKLQFCSKADALPEDGIVIYSGASPLDVTDFAGQLFLAGKDQIALTGDAPDAQIYVRMNRGAAVTVDGNVASVDLYTRQTRLDGDGSAKSVGVYAPACEVSLKADKTDKSYDDGLLGVEKAETDPVPALTPENRSVALTVSYKNLQPEGTVNGKRTCMLYWWIDGVRQPNRVVNLTVGQTAQEAFHVSESLWKRNMPVDSHKVTVRLMYGTDCITSTFTVPVKNYTDAEYAQIASQNAHPYRIEVVKNKCTVLVYGLDKSGKYSILHRTFVCSPGNATPIGTFYTPNKVRWGQLMGGVWGQYCTTITGGFLFHSVYYHTTDPSTLYYDAYNQLGTICSHGCVRVTVADAKWMYDNCPLGTAVTIYNSDTMPVPKATAQRIPTNSPYRGWDPTDPDPRNPWNK